MLLHCDMYKGECDEINLYLLQDYCKYYYKEIQLENLLASPQKQQLIAQYAIT
jgi:hypothetical protein